MALTDESTAIIKGMLLRGDDQHHIAALFGENAGRVAEVKRGMEPNPENKPERGRSVVPAATEDLPPPGPYFLNIMASRDIILTALEDSLEPMALYCELLERSHPRDEEKLKAMRLVRSRLRTALDERRRELWKGRKS